MNIAINTQLLIKDKLEGIGWFEYETLKRITKANPQHNFFFIFDRKWDDSFIFSENVTPLKTSVPSRHPFLWYYRFHIEIPQLLKKHKIDLFYSPDGWNVPKKYKSIIALHDLNFWHFPDNLPGLTSRYYKKYFPRYAKDAKRIVTVSEYSKHDIVDSFSIDPKVVDVVYNAASEVFTPLNTEDKNKAKAKFSKEQDYFAFVGALNPRKNLQSLMLAFDKFCQQSNPNINLVIAGEAMFENTSFKKAYQALEYKNRVHFANRLKREDVALLIGGAKALLLPSKFEGFGIPIVEAMNCDVPVLTSNTSCMPEIAGDAAYFVNPLSIESITLGLSELYHNDALRNSLIEKGKIQRKKYSWNKTAELLWQSIEKALYS
ncbi:MAG: glycosyltransferase family 4 protein [Flavobacteriales bacterium]